MQVDQLNLQPNMQPNMQVRTNLLEILGQLFQMNFHATLAPERHASGLFRARALPIYEGGSISFAGDFRAVFRAVFFGQCLGQCSLGSV